MVNEADQNQSWTTAKQFRSSLCQFVPLLGGRGNIHMLIGLAAVQLGQMKKQYLAPFLLITSLPPPQTHIADYGGSGHRSSLPWQATAQAAKPLKLLRPGFEPGVRCFCNRLLKLLLWFRKGSLGLSWVCCSKGEETGAPVSSGIAWGGPAL